MTLVTRPPMTDDTGTFTNGTEVDEAFIDLLLDEIDDQAHSATNPTIKPKAITDEVVTARGSKASLDARLDVALEEDGTPKAVAGQATETQVGRQQGARQLIRNPDFEHWSNGTALAPDYWTLSGAGATIVRATDPVAGFDLSTGQYAVDITSGAGAVAKLTQVVWSTEDMTAREQIRSRKVSVSARIGTTAASAVRVVVDDGVTTSPSAFVTTGSPQTVTVQHTLSGTATKLEVYLEIAAGTNRAGMSGMQLVVSDVQQPLWIPERSPWGWREAIVVARDVQLKGNVTTGETNIYATTIPARGLDSEGASIDVSFSVALANNTNVKTIKFYIGAQSVTLLSNASAVASNVGTCRLTVQRISSTGARLWGTITFGAASGAAPTVNHFRASIASLDWTVSQALKLTFQSDTATDDIQIVGWRVVLEP